MLEWHLVANRFAVTRSKPPTEAIDETCHSVDHWWACSCVVRRRISLLSEDVQRHHNSFAKNLAEQLVNNGLAN
jgi:hypothetical protein